MSICIKSRLSLAFFLLILFGCELVLLGQQKANDFTKRVGVYDGKISTLNGRSSNLNRSSPSSSRRISVQEWPTHFSPFGGKRYPMGNAKIWGSERVPSTRIEIKTPLNDKFAGENFERATNQNLSNKAPAANAVEFREAYYARLDDRVDEWMEKVNNISLRDINRYQFRKGRSNKPGFPVQRAGAETLDDSRKKTQIKESGLSEQSEINLSDREKSYWMGPKKIKSSNLPRSSNMNNNSGVHSKSESVERPARNFKSAPRPVLGPKTIRVEVGRSE